MDAKDLYLGKAVRCKLLGVEGIASQFHLKRFYDGMPMVLVLVEAADGTTFIRRVEDVELLDITTRH